MRQLLTNQPITRQQRDRRLLLLCVLLAVLFGLIGVNLVARLILSIVFNYPSVRSKWGGSNRRITAISIGFTTAIRSFFAT